MSLKWLQKYLQADLGVVEPHWRFLLWKPREAGSGSGEAGVDSLQLLTEGRHIWGAPRGAHTHFIDIQGFDPLTTGMSPRLRQPGLYGSSRVEKPGGPLSLLPTSTPLSWWSNQSSSTLSHSCGHFLSVFRCFLSIVLQSCYFTEVALKEFPAWDLCVCVCVHR